MKKLFTILIILFILLVIIGGAGVYWFLHYQSPETTVVEFQKGTSLRTLTGELQRAKVIPHAKAFEWFVRLQKKDKQIKSGEYEFEKGLKPNQVLTILVEGRVKYYPITIPEGYNLKDMEKLFIGRGLTTKEEWASIITKYETSGNPLEGYLFPNTYYLEKSTTIHQLIDQMIKQTNLQITSERELRLKEMGFSVRQWITLASIVEKETGLASERPLIASVFLNRLKIGMPLQTDPTVIYGIKNFSGNLTREHLQTDHPYNTYTRSGIPPGPICSPGLASLLAILNPAKEEYLYFVAKGNGSHYFSKTLEEHNQAVQKFQLNHE